jgi:hypothetical protein
MHNTSYPSQTAEIKPPGPGQVNTQICREYGIPRRTFMGGAFMLCCLVFMVTGTAMAQRSLKITRMRQIAFDTVNRAWSPWPATWKTFSQGNQPVLTITGKDAAGYMYHIDMVVSGKTYSFDVDYNGFDEKNNWTKYMDQQGDEIAIVGSNMSYLSQSGWPNNAVDIYFWIYSNNLAEEME